MGFENELAVGHGFPNEWDNKIMTHEWPKAMSELFLLSQEYVLLK